MNQKNVEKIQGKKNVDVAIIGAGITGLATAYYLRKRTAQADQPLRIALLEASSRAGGKILTESIDYGQHGTFVVEGGPDSFLTQKPWALQLSRELGLEERILGTNDHNRKVFVLNRGKLTPLPDGLQLVVPTRFMPFARSPLISPLGKLRMALDLFLPAHRGHEDETLADFITRRLGREVLDKIGEPLLSGIYSADPEKQSLLATFPRFRDMESKHGSLIAGMLAARRSRPSRQTDAATSDSPQPKSAFVSFIDGTEELVAALVRTVGDDIVYNCRANTVAMTDGGDFQIHCAPTGSIRAKVIVVAVPAYAAASILKDLAPRVCSDLLSIRYVSTGTLSFGYRSQDVQHPLNGFGVVIPRAEKRAMNAITWTSTKFDHRAPANHVMIRTFFGGSRNPTMVARDDQQLYTLARRELHEILGVDAEPIMQRLFRWQDANPQYDVGHLQKIDAIEAALPAGIFVSGSPYRGIGIPDCVHQAEQTTEKILSYH